MNLKHMHNLPTKSALLLWSSLFFGLPTWASDDYDDIDEEPQREEKKYRHDFKMSADTEGKGGATFKAQVPIIEGKTLYYTINLKEKPFGTVWEVSRNNDPKGKGWLKTIDPNIEELLAWSKKIFKLAYVEYVDETGEQSLEIGLIPSIYDEGQVLGCQIKTPEIDILVDVEGILRLIAKDYEWNHIDIIKGKGGGNQKAFQESKAGLFAFKMKWTFDNDDKLAIGVQCAKRDYQMAGTYETSSGFNIGRYIKGSFVEYTPSEPWFDLVHKAKVKYTRARFVYSDNKLVGKPGVTVSLDLGKIELLDEEPKVSLDISYHFCDINGKYGHKTTHTTNPAHLGMKVSATFKDPFNHKGLTIKPSIGFSFSQQDFSGQWVNNVDVQAKQDEYAKTKLTLAVSFSISQNWKDEYYL